MCWGGKGFGLHEKSTLSLDLSLTSSLGSVMCDRNAYIMVVRSIMDPYRHVFWTSPWKCSIFDFSFLISTPRRKSVSVDFTLVFCKMQLSCFSAVVHHFGNGRMVLTQKCDAIGAVFGSSPGQTVETPIVMSEHWALFDKENVEENESICARMVLSTSKSETETYHIFISYICVESKTYITSHKVV